MFRFGGIAQLGERLTGSQEVSGSIPLISTKKERQLTLSLFFNVGVLRNDRHGEAARGSLRSAEGAEHDRREYPAYLYQRKVL